MIATQRRVRHTSALSATLFGVAPEPRGKTAVVHFVTQGRLALGCALVLHRLQEPPGNSGIDSIGLCQRPLTPLFDIVG